MIKSIRVSKMTQIQKMLFDRQDSAYREFHSRLMPEIDKEKIMGVRTPELRKLAKQLYGTKEAEGFMQTLPHQYYDENNMHAFLIEQIKDYDTVILKLNEFLPFVDNWATCDMMRPKIFKKHLPELKEECLKWIKIDNTYTVRFGIVMLMTHFLDSEFDPSLLKEVSLIRCDKYYVSMAVAWYFATALAKQYDSALPFIESRCLDNATHRRTIQKAKESYRLTNEQKLYLKSLV